MYHFCTYFDSNYLLRGMTLYRSLTKHCKNPFRFYVLCLDEDVFNVLMKLDDENIVPIALQEVEQWDQQLLTAKGNRSRIEYYFTLSPVLPLYVLEHFDVDIVTYLDADLMFFSSPESIYDELGDASVFVTEHRFSLELQDSIKFGRFNVQCQAFRNDEQGRCCLHLWRKQCIEWCYDRLEGEKFADQKYLNEWPKLYGEHLCISSHPGIGVAPWNVSSMMLEESDGTFTARNKPLVFFHFHGFRETVSHNVFLKNLYPYHVHVTSDINALYRCYAYAFRAARAVLNDCSLELSDAGAGHALRHSHKQMRIIVASLRRGDVLFVR